MGNQISIPDLDTVNSFYTSHKYACWGAGAGLFVWSMMGRRYINDQDVGPILTRRPPARQRQDLTVAISCAGAAHRL